MLINNYSKPWSRIFFFVLKPNPMTIQNTIMLTSTKGILLKAIEMPIKAIAKIAPSEYRTKIHLIEPNVITSKIIDKKILLL